MNNDYINLVEFWNKNFAISVEEKEEFKNSIKDDDYLNLAPSKKLFDVLTLFKDKKHVLDYGAGSGWASIIMAKSGVDKIDAVDVATNSQGMINIYASCFNVIDHIRALTIDDKWLKAQEANQYDGIFCSNVLDVIPLDMAKDIIKEVHRIVKDDGLVVFSFNYYIDPQLMEQKGYKVSGSQVYIDNVLRLNSLSDEEWQKQFNKYFDLERLDYFAWPNEEKETRRLFVLRKIS